MAFCVYMDKNPLNIPPQSGQIVKSFQLDDLSIKDKSDDSYGLQLGKYIESTISGNNYNSYYFNRNQRFIKNRNAANGREDIQSKFADRLEFNGKFNYINIGWQSLHIQNRIISGLVGRWMGRDEKIVVTATDSLSVKDKQDEYDNLEFMMTNKDMLHNLQKASGVQIVPKNQFIPADKDELSLWQAQFQRTPEEILYETAINDILRANGFFDVIKEKLLHDSSAVGLLGVDVSMDKEGIIHVDLEKPENLVYSYSNFPDFRDTTWRGKVKSMKISELRKKYGEEFGGKLTEEQLWSLAETATEYNRFDKLTWNYNWNYSFMRPYDEWNIEVIEFYFKTVDSDSYTITETKGNKSTLIQKGAPKKIKDNQKAVEDTHINIYKGVYVRNKSLMLEWGIFDNMITPQNPKEAGNAEFPISMYMYQNYEMRNLAIPEKIEEPCDQMILCRLKIQQLVAKMIPVGAAINIDAMQELDYGLGDKNKAIDPQKLYEQTGRLYYRGKDAEGNPVPVPITELQNSGFVGQMQGLIALYNFNYGVLKDELGEDPNLITQAVQPRVTSDNVAVSQKASENATDYMYDAYLYILQDVARKVACLLHKSVTFGSAAYRHLLKQADIKDRVFNTDFAMLPTEQEMSVFNAMMNQAIGSNPEFVLYIDPFQLMRIAKEDVKFAEILFRQGQKKMIAAQQQQAAQNQQMNAQVQQESLQMKAQADMQHLQAEMQMKGDLSDRESKNNILESMVTGIMQIMAKGLDVQPEWKPVEQEIIAYTLMPLFAQNMQKTGALGSAIQQQQQALVAQQQQMQPAQQQNSQQGQQPQQQSPQDNQQPQPQQAA